MLNSLACGNCVDLMRAIPDATIPLTVTSPPYDSLRTYNGFSFDFNAIAQELFRITATGGVIAWIVNDQTINGSETGNSFRQALRFKEIGFNLHDTMIYKRSGIVFPDKTRYYAQFEFIFILSKGRPAVFNPICDHRNKTAGQRDGGCKRSKDGTMVYQWCNKVKRIKPETSCRSNVWEYHTGGRQNGIDPLIKNHPAAMPLKFASDLIRSWSQPGMLVFDPMAGSGQVAVASLLNDRQYLAFEISEAYCRLAQERVNWYRDNQEKGKAWLHLSPSITLSN